MALVSSQGLGVPLLDGGFMGEAQIGIDAMASAGAFPYQGPMAPGVHGDAHAGDVGDAPAFHLVPRRSQRSRLPSTAPQIFSREQGRRQVP